MILGAERSHRESHICPGTLGFHVRQGISGHTKAITQQVLQQLRPEAINLNLAGRVEKVGQRADTL